MRKQRFAVLVLTLLLTSVVGCLGEDEGEGSILVSSGNNGETVPEVAWMTSYGGSGEEAHGHFILACEDGGFLQIGETGFIPNSAKLLVVKVNATGELEWKKEFGSKGHNLGNSAIEVGDGYVVVGALDEDSTVIKLNKTTGSTVWSQTHNYGGSDAIEHVVATDTGFAAVGYIDAEDDENTFFTEGKGRLMLLDQDGEQQVDRSLNPHMAHAYRLAVHDRHLFISGLTEGAEDYALVKATLSGEVVWAKTYGGGQADHNFAFDMAEDGSMVLSGHTLSDTENWDTYTVNIDNDGVVLWEATHGNPRGFDAQYIHDEVWGLRTTEDGGAVVVAGTGDEYWSYSKCDGVECSDAWRVYVLKFDAVGTLEWEATYGP
ncbi:MAG: PQQ-binding-like beta-propeller repeat protein, partial [Candidatus Poseidonia sp.]|nr:PQQ-binding-like beta-propeller repeat protein [Poseidonia sp.]